MSCTTQQATPGTGSGNGGSKRLPALATAGLPEYTVLAASDVVGQARLPVSDVQGGAVAPLPAVTGTLQAQPDMVTATAGEQDLDGLHLQGLRCGLMRGGHQEPG